MQNSLTTMISFDESGGNRNESKEEPESCCRRCCCCCCRCCCPKKQAKKDDDIYEEEPQSCCRRFFCCCCRCCCPKKQAKKEKGSRKKSVALAEEKLLTVSEGLVEAAAKIDPKYLPMTFVPDFIIAEIWKDSFSNVPYIVTSNVVLLMADVCGFTNLCESYCQKGVAGIEELASILNGFMSTLSAMLLEGGGDILNFAGDAFLVQWIEESVQEGMQKAAKRAYECAVALQTHKCLQTKNMDGTLKVKIGIAMGEVTTWVLGSAKEFLLFVAAGPTVPCVQKAEGLCSPGDIVVDKNVHKLLKEGKANSFTPAEIDNDYVKVTEYPPAEGHEEPVPERKQLFEKCDANHIEMAKIFLIPALRGLKSANELEYVSELTMVTILFIALLDVDAAEPKVLDSTFDIILASVLKYEGVLNKMLLFDKGCTFLVAFGLPGLKHSNDAARGIRCAENIIDRLKEIEIKGSIGVSSGTCFCGIVGHAQRQEYTVIGSRVNMAARIMVVYNDQPIALNLETYHLSRDELGLRNFVELPFRKMKGIDSAGAIYAYRKQLSSKSSTSVATFDIVEDSNLHGSDRVKEKIRQCVAAMHDEEQRKQMKDKTLLPVLIIKGQGSSGKNYMMFYTVDSALAIDYKCAVCCAIPSYFEEPFSIISRLIQRMMGMTMTESCIDRENLLMSYLPSSTYKDLYLLNHFFNCLFPVPETIMPDMKDRDEKFASLAKIIIHKFCKDHCTLIAVDNADYMDDQSWYIIHQLAEEEMILVVLTLSMDFKEINVSASVLLLKAYMHVNMESSQEDYFAPLLCWFLGVRAVHTKLFTYLKEITDGKTQLLKEVSLCEATSRITKIVPFESIDKERLKSEFYVDKIEVLTDKEPMACDLKPGINLKTALIPTNINDAVKESLSSLTIQDRLLLKRASVLGADFDLHSLESISTGMRRTEVLECISNLLSNNIFTSVCTLEHMIEATPSEFPTVALGYQNICFCFHVYMRTKMKHLEAKQFPIGPYHRLKFRVQEFRTCMLAYMTKEQVYSMRMEVADSLESNGPECASCKSKRTKGIDETVMNKEMWSYSFAFKQCTCLIERPRLYSEIAVLYTTLGMLFLPTYYKRKAAQAANNIYLPIQALYYVTNAQNILPQYSLMSEEDRSPEEAYFDPLILEISLKKTAAEAFLLLGDTYNAASYVFQAMEMLGMEAACFHGGFNPNEFRRLLRKFPLLHAEYMTKLVGVLAKTYLKADLLALVHDLLIIEYTALKYYPIDFIQVLNHMVSMYRYKFLVHKKDKLTELENNIFRICRKRLHNFDVLLDLTELNAVGSAYCAIIEVNFALSNLVKSENTANEAVKILLTINDEGTLPQIRVWLCLIHYTNEDYEKFSGEVIGLGKISAVSKCRSLHALYICCLSLFLTKSLEGIHKTEIQLNYDKCNAFASEWKNETSRIIAKDLAFYVSVILSNWCLYSDENTTWIAGKDVFKQCYEISKDLHKSMDKSKHNYWIISASIMLLEIQLRIRQKDFEDLDVDVQSMKDELDLLKDKIKSNYPIYMETYKKLVVDVAILK